MLEHSNALAALHRQLAYRPDRQKLAVTVTDDHASVSIDGQPAIALPAGMHRQYLTDMLAHYPVPVSVNGQNIQASPRFDEFIIARACTEGAVSDARLHPLQLVTGRYPRSVILLDRVLYTLGDCPQLDAEHPWHLVTSYEVPDRQDQQPHFARWSEYRVLPCYVWQTAAHQDVTFSFASGQIRCHPSANVYRQLQDQRPEQEQRAARLIQEYRNNGELPPPSRVNNRDYPMPPRAVRSYGQNSAALFVYAEAATMDAGSMLSASSAQCLADALYRNPAPGLVPVAYRNESRGKLPNIDCEAISVTLPDGATQRIRQPIYNYASRADARAIIAHLTVQYPDGSSRSADLPLELFCEGLPGDETVILTYRWQEEHITELTDILCRNYSDDSQEDESDLRRHLNALAIRLLAVDRAGHIAQLQRLCDSYHPHGGIAGITRLTVENEQHRITWEPVAQTPPDQAAQLIAELAAGFGERAALDTAHWQNVTRHATGPGYEYWTVVMADDSVLDVNPVPSAASSEPWLWAVVHSANSPGAAHRRGSHHPVV